MEYRKAESDHEKLLRSLEFFVNEGIINKDERKDILDIVSGKKVLINNTKNIEIDTSELRK